MNNRLCTLTTVMQAILILTYSVSNKDLLENKNYITLHKDHSIQVKVENTIHQQKHNF